LGAPNESAATGTETANASWGGRLELRVIALILVYSWLYEKSPAPKGSRGGGTIPPFFPNLSNNKPERWTP